MIDAQAKGIPLDVILLGLYEAELVTEWRIKNERNENDRFVKRVRTLAKEYGDYTIATNFKAAKKK
jgi:hypothetical protein